MDIATLSENQARGVQMFRACDADQDHELTKPEVELCEHPRVVPLRAHWENNLNNTMSEKELLDMQQYSQDWIENWVAEYSKGHANVFRIYQSNAVLGMISEGMLPMSAETRRPWAKVSAADVVKIIRLKYGVDIPEDLVSIIPESDGEVAVKPKLKFIYDTPFAKEQQRQSPSPTPKREVIRQEMKKAPCIFKGVMTDAELDACRR